MVPCAGDLGSLRAVTLSSGPVINFSRDGDFTEGAAQGAVVHRPRTGAVRAGDVDMGRHRLRRMDIAPGPLHVDVVTHAGNAPGTLKLRVSTAGTTFSETTIQLGDKPGAYSGLLQVDQPGPCELGLDDGTDTASIPFIVPARVIPPWEKATFGGFVAAGVFLVIGLVVAMRVRRPQLALIPAGGMVAALAVAITGAWVSASTPPPPVPGSELDPTIDNVTDPYANTRS